MTFKHSIMLNVTASLLANTAPTDIEVSFTGSLSSNTDLGTLRGAKITIEGIDAAGGMSGEKLVLVSADTGEDVTEDAKAYGYLAETEEVDFIISGSINDVNLDWLPRMQEFRASTLDTWTSYIGTTDMVIEDPETMTLYFTDIASDETLAVLYINFDADMLKREMGWDSVAILTEDTAFGEAITGLVTEALGSVAGIETKEIITYGVNTVDLAPLFSRAQASGADFIYQVSSVNSQVISSQYVKLQIPITMTGTNVSALGLEHWEDTDGAGGSISTPSPIPPVSFRLDPESQKSVNTYRAKYDSRPKMLHFNGFNTYWGLKQAVVVVKAAGGFDDAEAWSTEIKKQDITLKKSGKV